MSRRRKAIPESPASPRQASTSPPRTSVEEEVVESILGVCWCNGEHRYKVKWDGASQCTFESYDCVKDCEALDRTAPRHTAQHLSQQHRVAPQEQVPEDTTCERTLVLVAAGELNGGKVPTGKAGKPIHVTTIDLRPLLDGEAHPRVRAPPRARTPACAAPPLACASACAHLRASACARFRVRAPPRARASTCAHPLVRASPCAYVSACARLRVQPPRARASACARLRVRAPPRPRVCASPRARASSSPRARIPACARLRVRAPAHPPRARASASAHLRVSAPWRPRASACAHPRVSAPWRPRASACARL